MSHQADTDADTETFKYRGDRIDPLRNNKGTIEAKITDWYCSNEIRSTLGTASSSEGEEEPEAKRYKSFDREYVIRIFATTKRGTSIGINVFNHTPHFFVEVPEKIAQNKYKLSGMVAKIKGKMARTTRENLLAFDVEGARIYMVSLTTRCFLTCVWYSKTLLA